MIAIVIYWLDSLRAKEIATLNASQACQKLLLEFLDDTVVIKKIRLRRNIQGSLMIYRDYEFEFASSGEFRYKGHVRLLGQYVLDVDMERYQFNDIEAE